MSMPSIVAMANKSMDVHNSSLALMRKNGLDQNSVCSAKRSQAEQAMFGIASNSAGIQSRPHAPASATGCSVTSSGLSSIWLLLVAALILNLNFMARPVLAQSGGSTGTIDFTTPVDISVDTLGQNAELTFSGTAGQQINAWAINCTFPGGWDAVTFSILNPDGSTLASTTLWGQGNVGLSLITLPTTGTYTIVVAPQDGTGSATVVLSLEQMGTIAAGTPDSLTVNTPGQNVELTFSGTAGQQVNAWALNSTFPGGNDAVTFSILNPDGSTLTSASLWGQGNVGLPLITLPTTGTYTILLAPQNGGIGSATVVLSLEQTGTLTAGTQDSLTVSTPGQNAELTFSGTAGQQVNAWALNSTFPGGYDAVTFSILNPDGSTLASSSLWGQGNVGLPLITLPTTGNYTILLAPQNGGTGSATVVLSFEQTGTITVGNPVNVTVNTPGQNAELTFSGTTGQEINAWAINSTFPGGSDAVTFSILNPDGSTLASTSLWGQGNVGLSFITLPSTGTYTILLAPQNGVTGSATVVLSMDQTGTISAGTPDTLTVNTPGQNAEFTFSGAAGQSANVQLTDATFPGACYSVVINILNPDGSTLISQSMCGQGNFSTGSVSLPASGTYTLVIAPQNRGTGSAAILLSESGTQAATPIFSLAAGTYLGAQTLTISDSTPGATIYYTTDGSTPTTSSTQYTGAIAINYTETIQAAAIAPALMLSAAATTSYTISGPPNIAAISPASGVVGTTVTITGSVFGTSQGSSTVTLNGAPVTPISWSAATIVFAVPSGATTGNVVVSVAGNQSNGMAFTVADPTQGFNRPITIHHSLVPNTDQTNFPVLISGTYPFLATQANGGRVLNPNGYDIIFTTDAAGQNLLPFEIDNYNAATGAVGFWVLIPTLSHTTDTTIYIWYGINGLNDSQQNAPAVWQNGYVAVYHMGSGSTLSSWDSTGINGSATNVGVTPGLGQIGGAGSFASGADYLQVANNPALKPGSALTLEAWVNPTSVGDWNKVIGLDYRGDGSWNSPYLAYALQANNGSDQLAVQITQSGSGTTPATSASFALSTWSHVAGTYDGSQVVPYLNGVAGPAASLSGPIDYGTSQDLTIGARSPYAINSSEGWNGLIDEVRISSVARSADWIATEFNNQSSPASFFSMGQESGSGGPIATVFSATPNPALVGQLVTVTGVGFGSTQGNGTLTVNGVAISPATWSDSSITFGLPAGASSGPLVVTSGSATSFPIAFVNDGVSSGNGLIGTYCPPLQPGQQLAWATPQNVSAIQAPEGSVNGLSLLSANIDMTFSRSLGNWWVGASWSNFFVPDLPADAVIQGIYAGEQFTASGSGAYLSISLDTPFDSMLQNTNTSATGFCSGNLLGSSTPSGLAINLGSIPNLQLNSFLFQTLFQDNFDMNFAPSDPGIAIYYTASSSSGSGPSSTVTWATPAPIAYGTPLSAAQLDATTTVPGTFVYSPTLGTVLPPGSNTLMVTFTPDDLADYATNTTSVTLTVNPAAPVICWTAPAPIAVGTALSGTQLNATANVAGTFSYSPAAGTELAAGENTLTVTFTPSDTTDYATTTASVSLTVKPQPDIGTIALTMGGTTIATASYDGSSTPDSIAAALAGSAGSATNSPVTVTAVNGTLYMAANAAGASGDDLSFSFQVNSSVYSQPVFSVSPASGNLDGGDNANAAGGSPIYSYAIPSYQSGSTPTGYDAVGNVVGYSDQLMTPSSTALGTFNATTDSWLFAYDNLNRLTGATGSQVGPNSTTGLNYCWQYDAFGNRTLNYPGACSSNLPQIPYGTNNQLLSGLQAYDAAGNVTTDVAAGNTYLYDAEGRVCAVSSLDANSFSVMTGYVYNADGVRVAKGPITTMSCDPAISGLLISNETDFVIGPSGEQLTEMGNGGTNWVHTNVFVGGELFATYDPSGLHFYANDWLGSRRVQTDYAGVPEQSCTNLPFGDNLNCSQSLSTPTEQHFTGKERDTESGNDYFGARYYASSMGRWMSPDWNEKVEPVPYSKLDDPQTLNLYTYVLNNPLVLADADGHTTDTYVPDIDKHGGAHIDRYTKGGQNVGRYRPDGTPIKFKGKTPGPVPNADKGKFGEAAAEIEKKQQARQQEQNLEENPPPVPAPPTPDGLKPDPPSPFPFIPGCYWCPNQGPDPSPKPMPFPGPAPGPIPLPEPTPFPIPEPIPVPTWVPIWAANHPNNVQ